MPAVFLALPFIAVARRDSRTRHLLALAVWFGAIAAFYSAYAITQESWSCLRFLLPALPALIFAALLGVDAGSRLFPSHWPACVRASAAILLIAWSTAISWYWTRKFGVLYVKGYEQVYADANAAARAQLPNNALIVASFLSGGLYFYTDFPVLRWDQIKPTDFTRYAALAQKAGRPVYAVLHEFEEKDALREHCPGDWTRVSAVKSVGFWRFTPLPAAADTLK